MPLLKDAVPIESAAIGRLCQAGIEDSLRRFVHIKASLGYGGGGGVDLLSWMLTFGLTLRMAVAVTLQLKTRSVATQAYTAESS